VLDVFLTFDTEIWCDDWNNLNAKFPDAFQRYIYSATPKGNYGLPHILRQLEDNGLKGVFFVEPFFATRFGLDLLSEIITLIQERKQEVQLHPHTEWVDESRDPLIDNIQSKKQLLRHFSLSEQITLIQAGANLIEKAGGGRINAFRAGNFGFNRDTLRALAANDIPFDSSYNATMYGLDSGVHLPDDSFLESVECEGVYEFPVTIFHDGLRLRHTQVTACSYQELEGLLWQALHSGRKSFVIFSHNFEFLNKAMNRPDYVAVSRFTKLCAFLDRHQDCFRVCGFQGLSPSVVTSQPIPLISSTWKTSHRMFEQTIRKIL
jgi:peptidoglycan/xylan/chitin deacetylase (PgdA/CDA1 family)